MQLTNGGEVGAFILARAIMVVVLMVGTPLLLAQFYLQLYQTGGAVLVTVVSVSISVLGWLVTLFLFLAFRAGFGAVPAIVAGQGRRDVMTSSAAEIGAYLIALVIVMSVFYVVNAFVLSGVYVWIRQSGQLYLTMPLSIAIALVTAIVFFLLFIAMRSALSPAPAAGGPIEWGG
jgi:hypothetical protein